MDFIQEIQLRIENIGLLKKIRMIKINDTLRRLKTGKTILLEFWKCLGDEYRIVKKACQ